MSYKADKSKPKISVIIPVYNTEEYLGDCLESILKQSFIDFEVICINDGSTDNSYEIIEQYKQQDKRIKAINSENYGPSESRNKGITESRGEYIVFVDSDDVLAEGALERIWSSVKKEKPDMLVQNAIAMYDSEEMQRKYNNDAYCLRKHKYTSLYTGEELFAQLIENNEFREAVWLMVLKRDFVVKEELKFECGMIHEDVLFSLISYLKADKVRYTEDINYVYRVRLNSIMRSKVSMLNISSRLKCYDSILKLALVNEYNKRTKEALITYLMGITDELKSSIAMLGDAEINWEIISKNELIHAYAMGLIEKKTSLDNKMYELGFERLIQQYDRIYIYGAGKVGASVYAHILKLGSGGKIVMFVETYVSKERNFMNMPVKGIDEVVPELLLSNNSLVIVAVQKKYQQEIARILNNVGINDYININESIQKAMEE